MTQEKETNHSRIGLFGDLPTRAVSEIIERFPNMPYAIEAFLLHFFAFIVLVLAKEERQAIRNNLKVINKGNLSVFQLYAGVFLVFRNFGWCFIDSIRAKLGQDVISWEVEGKDVFNEIVEENKAAMLFTTHTGNYDLAGALFAEKFGRTLHTVRIPERSEHLQKIHEKELEKEMERYPNFKVHYNRDSNLLGIELARLLREGELLAIQADRVIADVVPISTPLADGENFFRIPKGPMTLASFANCPCYPLFVVRDSFRQYRIIFEPALEVENTSGRRTPSEMDYSQAWRDRLLPLLEQYPYEWFVFENAFTK